MKFIKTLNLWDASIERAIKSGKIKLQVGQWLICGLNNDKRCRYVSHNKHTITVTHWQGSSKATNDLFMRKIAHLKLRK